MYIWIFQTAVFLFILTAICVLVGVVALIQMPRDEFPTFTIRQGIIVGVFPGASSQQVEEQGYMESQNR